MSNDVITPAGAPATPAAPATGANDAITPAQAQGPQSIYDRYFSRFGAPPDDAAGGTGTGVAADPEVDAAARGAEALVNELTQMRQAIAAMQAAGDAKGAADAAAKVKGFIEYMQAGDPAAAEAALSAKLEAQISSRIVGEATRKAVQVANAQNDLSNYGQRLLAENPDLVPVQDLIEQNAQYLVGQAKANRLIPEGDLSAYVQAYKSALRQSVERLRTFGAARAGAGAQNAATRNTEVLRAGTIPPSTQNRDSASQQGATPGATQASGADQAVNDAAWLAQRKAKQMVMRNMS